MGEKPLEGAKNWFWFAKLLGPVLVMLEVQVRVQFLKALPALSNSGALKMPASSVLVLKSFYSVVIVFFLFLFIYFFNTRHQLCD